MEPVLRATGCYLLLLVIVRIGGKRGLAQVTVFDFIVLLLISQAVGQALVGDDASVTSAVIITVTLVVLNHVNDRAAHRWADMSHVLEDAPLVLIEHGRVHDDRLAAMKIRLEDILESARQEEGVERLDQVKHAVLERSGAISIITRDGDQPEDGDEERR